MQYTNKFNMPSVFVDLINYLTYDLSEGDPKRIGVTTLINPPRIRVLTVRHWKELTEDTSDQLWRILGSAVHWVVEKVKPKGDSLLIESTRVMEQKLEIKIDDFTVVGKLDLYEKIPKSIEDLKITSVWSFQLGDKEDWDKQLNIYAWLLRKNNIEVNKAFINAILRDWRKSEVFKYENYPKIPFVRKEIDLWSFEEQDNFVNERLMIYKDALAIEKDEDLPLCTPEERWAKEGKFAVYKNKQKKAVRLLDTKNGAEKWAKANISKLGDTYHIEERPGVDMKCLNYCNVAPYCNYWKSNYGTKK